MNKLGRFLCCTAISASFLSIQSIQAQPVEAQAPDTIVVFDGSGSMWGQIEGRTKIEIARDTLSSVLSEVSSSQRMGMIAYGHRKKGQCSDIETIVPVGSANQTVPAMIDAANAIKPKGKTPLTDAVRKAANELRHTENAATVILVTDGIETCDADPCALASELEQSGVNFTSHVVGFGLSRDEGRQVQCLAENTGGLYLPAQNADELKDALRRTVEVVPDEDFEDDANTREVHFLLRDTPSSELLGTRQLEASIEGDDGSSSDTESFLLNYPEVKQRSATATLQPGTYALKVTRKSGTGGYNTIVEFEVPEGEGTHIVDLSLSGALKLNVFINPNLPHNVDTPLPIAIGGSGPRYSFSVFAVENGEVAAEPIVKKATSKLMFPLPAGKYLVRGNISRTTTTEKLVEVKSGPVTEFDFSFDTTRVFVEAVDENDTRVKRQTTYWYDGIPEGRSYFVKGNGISNNEVMPFYLPTGSWGLNVGGEGYGKRRSQFLVKVPGDYQDIRLKIGVGKTLADDQEEFLNSAQAINCLEFVKVDRTGCLVKRVQLSSSAEQSSQSSDNSGGSEKSVQASGTSEVKNAPVAGIFNLHNDVKDVSNILQDLQHSQGCTRRPIVFFPDGSIAFRQFDETKIESQNPYTVVATGGCEVSGNDYQCEIKQSVGGSSKPWKFNAKAVGESHFELCEEGKNACDMAVSCFTPDGEIQAKQKMPNNRELSEMMTERPDGKKPGFGYNTDNKLVRQ